MDNGKNTKVTKKIIASGIVQGVGFRPLVYLLAQKYGIKGTVRNLGGIVEIIASSSSNDFNLFLEDLKASRASIKITNLEVDDINDIEFSDFKISDSGESNQSFIIPPDLAICDECQNELTFKNDRRFKNPFISCMSCGPRYTIIEKLPYDRENTTMTDFEMCPLCRQEYISPKSRRFHAQTISCNDCGPYLIFNDSINEEALNNAINIIKSGGIVAVKGIGGYHFACSPFSETTVLNLRKLKGREEKPFAVMFDSLNSIENFCISSDEEKNLLTSKEKPIVLLYMKDKSFASSVTKDSIYCGAFLPYTPLQILLTQKCGPLVMTSANISNKPIIKDHAEMLSLASPLLDGVLYNKRRIVRSVDDSVTKVIDNKPQIIRRSRGYVPYPVFLNHGDNNLQVFASGSDLKAAFCLYKDNQAFVSQYFGDLEDFDVLSEYKNSAEDLSRLLNIKPKLAVCDLHPNYHSSKYAKALGIPTIMVQHHHAHIASVMAENNLVKQVIGVAFDGTGYGTDGNVWGGEFLICEGADFKRRGHLKYTPILGGDSSVKDAKKTATCFLLNTGLSKYTKDNRKDIIEAAIKNKVNTVLTSSMGRLFDAVASILDIGQINTYEGECAARLEREAVCAIRKNTKYEKFFFSIDKKSDNIIIDPKSVLESMCALKGADIGSLALGFHVAVADLIVNMCDIIRSEQNINTVALSGGVFQNTVLLQHTLKLLREKDFKVYYNRLVPPNDGSISLGQTYMGVLR